MTIEKNGTIYTVKENKTGWTLTTLFNGVTVSYNITKADCSTIEALKKFVAENDAI